MQKFVCLLLLSLIYGAKVEGQSDNVGSGHALHFDGIDDYVDLGDKYHDVNLPFSISAWIYIDPTVNYPVPIFVLNDNDPVYRGFWFFISQSLIWCEFGDGTGGSTPSFRRGKQAMVSNVIGRWINVSAVMKAPFDISLYVNGVNVGGNSMGESNLSMASSFSGDHPKIGYFLSNNVTYRFKGVMDEIRFWNRALLENEIRDQMCRSLTGNETGLIGYWNFNELSGGTAFDKSTRAHHGSLMGTPTRVFSGAPIGETSIYDYRVNWTGITREITKGDDKLMVSNVMNNPEGIHLYSISSKPSQSNGLDASNANAPYFGVFLASLDNNNTFDVTYSFQNKTVCKVYQRFDNSVSTWALKGVPSLNILQRSEYVKSSDNAINYDLGADIVICHSVSQKLDTKITDPAVSILWSTGETTPFITINQPGKFWVRVENSCGISSDTIRITQLTPPPVFSLGENQTLCEMKPTQLKPYADPRGFEFTWQDNSTNDTFLATQFGTYTVEVKNACGKATGTIRFEQTSSQLKDIPNVITPNGDAFNQYFAITEGTIDYGDLRLMVVSRWGKQVYFSEDYKNNWDGGDLASGVYFYKITGRCIADVKGSLTIIK